MTVESVGNSDHMVLYADDQQLNRTLLKKLLEKEGIGTTCVNDGDKVVQLIQEFSNYKIIILDEEMNNMNGSQTAKEIKKLGFEVLVFRYSSNSPSSTNSKADDSAFDEKYLKPSQSTELKRRVLTELEQVKNE